MNVDLIEFGRRLSGLRTERGLSQEKLAQELGYSKSAISFYELGKRTADIEFLATAAKYFNVSYDYLLGISGNKTTNAELKDICKYTGLSENTIEYIKAIDEKERYILNLLFETNEIKIIVNSITICALCHCMKINFASFYKDCERLGDENKDKCKKTIIDAETNKREHRFHIDFYMREIVDTVLKEYARKELALSDEIYEELFGLAEAIVKENDKTMGRLTLDDLKFDW